jgi:formate hydrogenlyase subunit 3/multisubunit Na+/H+ antiporter MnhD subunit
VGSLSILALPPSGGFAGKWLLLSAALRDARWGVVGVMLTGGVLAAAYTFRVLEQVISPAPDESHVHAPAAMQGAALVLAAAAVGLGMVPWAPLELLAAAPPAGGAP